MMQHIDEEEKVAVLACHSANSFIFKIIENSVDAISLSRDKKQVIGENKPKYKSNYWDNAEKNAKKYGMDTVEYLSMDHFDLPERNQEHITMLEAALRNTRFVDEVKRSIIKANKGVVHKAKRFLERTNKERTEDKRRED